MSRLRCKVAGVLGVMCVVCATAAMAQEGFFSRRGRPFVTNPNVTYDGQFTFVRLRHGLEGFGRGEPPWAHDYPRAERNFSRILQEITLIKPHLTESNVFTLDDPGLFAYPVAYVSEPGFWHMNDQELRGIQDYLRKGGFLIFDDFRDEHWYNFEDQMRRVVPDGRLVPLDTRHPVFHSFFDINTAETQGVYGTAQFHGMFEDNDPDKRLLLVANYNHDLGELWEFSDTGFVPVDLSNDAYKYGINYIVYAMTH